VEVGLANYDTGIMTIDSLRLLTDSAAILWQRLSQFGSPDLLGRRVAFEEWLAATQPRLSSADEQAIRRDYRRLSILLAELERLTCSREQALALIMHAIDRSAAGKSEPVISQPQPRSETL